MERPRSEKAHNAGMDVVWLEQLAAVVVAAGLEA